MYWDIRLLAREHGVSETPVASTLDTPRMRRIRPASVLRPIMLHNDAGAGAAARMPASAASKARAGTFQHPRPVAPISPGASPRPAARVLP